MISAYLLDLIILLTAAVVAVPLFQFIRLGVVPGFLIAGIAVGPSGLGLIKNVTEIGYVAEIGVVLLLFVIGVELKPSRLWLMRQLVFGLGSLQVLLTGIILSAFTYQIFDISLKVAIFIGSALALSSTAFVLQLINEQKLLKSVYGRTSFSVLLMQDLAVVPLLALIPLLTTSNFTIGEDIGIALIESVLILVLVILLSRNLLNPILHLVAKTGNSEVFTASALLLVLGTAYITEHIGLSMAMGAFLAGLLISDSSYKHQVMAEVQPFRGLLLGIFFMSMGMSLSLGLFLQNPLISMTIVLCLLSTKALILFLLSYLFGLNIKNSSAVALILAQSGEFSLVLFSLAYQSQLLSNDLFQQLLLIVLLSMLLTPLLGFLSEYLVKSSQSIKLKAGIDPQEAPIVLVGFGRVGHRIGRILSTANRTFVAIDSDAKLVEKERKNGYPVYFGDVCQPEVLKSAGVSQAQMIIVSINNPQIAEQLVNSLHQTYPDIDIFARGHNSASCLTLKSEGATATVSENLEASLELARMALTRTGVKVKKQNQIIQNFREKYHAHIENDI